MSMFEDWVLTEVPAGHRPVFTAFNAAFDWMFVADYFERHLGRNPFGHSALDIKAFAMGSGNTSWAATSMDVLAAEHLGGRSLTHNALADAQDQAELFRHLLDERDALTTGGTTTVTLGSRRIAPTGPTRRRGLGPDSRHDHHPRRRRGAPARVRPALQHRAGRVGDPALAGRDDGRTAPNDPTTS